MTGLNHRNLAYSARASLRMAFADRDALVEDDPATYYLKEHYLNHPCVLMNRPW
jgi:hypothetical protein